MAITFTNNPSANTGISLNGTFGGGTGTTLQNGTTPSDTATTTPNLFGAGLTSAATSNYSAPTGGGSGGGTTPTNNYYGGASTAAGGSDLAYLDAQQKQYEAMLNGTNTSLDQGLYNLNNGYNQQVSNTNLQRSRALEDYNTQDQLNQQHENSAFNQVDTNSRNLNNSMRRVLGLAGAGNSSASQELFPHLIADQASGGRNNILTTNADNQAQVTTARNRASQDFQSLLDNLSNQRNQQESTLRNGVLTNQQQINQQLANIAAQRSAAQGLGYSGALAAQNPYTSAIQGEQSSIDNLFNQFKTPQFDVKAVNPQTVNLRDYLVNSANLGTQNAQTQDPNATSSYYLNKLKNQDQTA